MPINEYEFYNGVVLNRLIRKGTIINIDIFPSKSANSFIINGKVGIYIKYSRKVTSPWRFTFKKNHQDEMKIMSELREGLWAVVQQAISTLDTDFVAYADSRLINCERLATAQSFERYLSDAAS